MDDLLISEIQTFTLKGRAALEDEGAQQLEGIFGWLPDGSFAAAEKYPAIAQLDEARETRQRLEQFAVDEKAIGIAGKDARTKLVREIAFTWLNRSVAFRLLEERRLIKETISRLGDSNAFKLWLADDANEFAYAEYQKGGLPLNAMGEGPSDVAYRGFLLWQCGELAKDVSVLFDPLSLASRLCPRPLVLKQLVADMNAADLADAWKSGNEETVGWIYQAFNAEEKRATFDAFSKGKKITKEQIAPATQIFTLRWVVRFLIENSLGRLWLEMHPDSRLKDSLGYLVPLENRAKRPLKLARDISFLDPCCGSMHFGLIAFELFAEIYREEMERADEPGWPETASVDSADQIPASIVAYNIHGIDIDLRAIQLSALTLFLRARTLNSNCAFTDANLSSANVEQITGGRLEEFIQQAHFSHPIYERTLRAVAVKLRDSDNLGSLLRLDRDLEKLIADERKKAETDKQFRLAFPMLTAETFNTQAGIEEFFEILLSQIMQHLDEFVRASRTTGNDAHHFVTEAAKGLRFLRLIANRYDVVATNPPYLDSRDYNQVHKAYLESEYPAAKRNLFSAFILRSLELAREQGLVGMLTGQSFMFISSFEDLRKQFREMVAIQTLAQFDYGLFRERVDTAAFVFRREPDAKQRDGNMGIYFRLVKGPDAESKRRSFEHAVAAVRNDQTDPLVFRCLQKDFDAIPGKPWVYWMPPGIRKLFRECESLKHKAKPRQGLATADNTRFLRYWWEIGLRHIAFGCHNRGEALASGKRWFPYNKGGASVPWHRRQDYVVDWARDGAAIRCFGAENGYIRSRPQNVDYYFREGITWTLISPIGFSARISPTGFIFDINGMTCFPSVDIIPSVMGTMNSSIGRYLLSSLNPTIAFQVGDIERLPIPTERSEKIDQLVNQCIVVASHDSRENETTYDFIEPLRALEEPDARFEKLADLQTEIDSEVSRLYNLTDEDFEAIDRELSVAMLAGGNDDGGEGGSDDESEILDELNAEECAQRWVSYAIGMVLSRFEIGVADGLGRGDFAPDVVDKIRKLVDDDGVMISDTGNPQDIVKRSLECVELMLGRDIAHEMIRTASSGEGDAEDLLRGFVDRQFWKYHYKMYRKRPVYWPLQSPKKKFSVWVFHERFTKDTLFKIRTEFVEPKVRWLESRIRELKDKVKSNTGRESRNADREASQLADVLDDAQEFAKRLNAINQQGYRPHIDDGVLLNAAPLWELLPSWPETKKAWQELEAGKYDWARQAMEYWPERVKEVCKTNKSFAIAHGLA